MSERSFQQVSSISSPGMRDQKSDRIGTGGGSESRFGYLLGGGGSANPPPVRRGTCLEMVGWFGSRSKTSASTPAADI